MKTLDLIDNYIQKRIPEIEKVVMGTFNITEETLTSLKKENTIHKKIIIEWEEMNISEPKQKEKQNE